MFSPSLDEIREIAENPEYKRIPVSYELFSDIATPIEVLRILKAVSKHTYMLESVEDSQKWGRYTFLGFNPLQASIEVKLHAQYANADSLSVIEKKIKQYTSVSELLYRKDMMQLVNENVKRVSLILFAFAAVLMVISFVLIGNTIRLLIYSRRFLIHTMKLVGATAGFIRRPFLWYNVVSGIWASFIAILLLTGALYYLQNELSGFIHLLDMKVLFLAYAGILFMGIFISVLATFFAVNKYLKMSIDKLYYV